MHLELLGSRAFACLDPLTFERWTILALIAFAICTCLYCAHRIWAAESVAKDDPPGALRPLSIDFGDGIPVDGYTIVGEYGLLAGVQMQGAAWIAKARQSMAGLRELATDYEQRSSPVLQEILRLLELQSLDPDG
jgi:hypothetical protein